MRKLTSHATLDQVIDRMPAARRYFGAVLRNMLRFKEEHGVAYVSIGLDGSGQHPNYRLYAVKFVQGHYPDATFSGQNHRPLKGAVPTFGVDWDRGDSSWSELSLSISEVEALLRSLPRPARS